MSVHRTCTVSLEARRGNGCPGTGVVEDGELLCGCWEQNLGALSTELTLLMMTSMISVHYTDFVMVSRI